MPAQDVWHAPTWLRQYAIPPRSVVSVTVDASRLVPGDLAGFVLFDRPYAWFAVERSGDGIGLALFDATAGITRRSALSGFRVCLDVACDFAARTLEFRGGHAGSALGRVGGLLPMGREGAAGRGIECALFCCRFDQAAAGGEAAFDSFVVDTDWGR